MADRGSAVISDADSRFCLSYVQILGPKGNLDHRSLFILSHYVNEFIQIISFFERSSFKLGCKSVIVAVLCFSHHTCCLLYIWVKLTVAFTCTVPVYLLTFTRPFSDVVVVLDLNKNFGGSTDFAKQRQGRADLLSPIHVPLIKFAQYPFNIYSVPGWTVALRE